MKETQIENLSSLEKDQAIKSARKILKKVSAETAAELLGISANTFDKALKDIFQGG